MNVAAVLGSLRILLYFFCKCEVSLYLTSENFYEDAFLGKLHLC